MSNTTTATKVKERPILFSGPMIRAIMEGRKTQTRRIMKPQPSAGVRRSVFVPSGIEDGHGRELKCPYGEPGDILWVRESFWIARQYSYGIYPSGEPMPAPSPGNAKGAPIHFAADGDPENTPNSTYPGGLRNGAFAAPEPYAMWHKFPSIHLPRWAARIYLLNEGVRVQRLGDISEEDSIAEGVEFDWSEGKQYKNYSPRFDTFEFSDPIDSFRSLWQSINGEWNPDLWIWAVTFRVLSTTGKPLDL